MTSIEVEVSLRIDIHLFCFGSPMKKLIQLTVKILANSRLTVNIVVIRNFFTVNFFTTND